MRIRRAADEVVAALDVIAFLHVDDLRFRHQIFDLGRTVIRNDRDLALRLIVLLEGDLAGHLGDDRILLRLARLEELGDARQTAGDVTRTSGFPRHTGEHLAGLDRLAVFDRDNRASGQTIDACFLGAFTRQGQARTQVLFLRLGRILGDDALDDTGGLVGLLGHGPVFDQVLVLHGTGLLGDDWAVGGIPLSNTVATADDMAALAKQVRAVRHAVRREFTAVHVEVRLLVELCRAADVEGPHRQLGARLTDRLGGNDADRFTDVHRRTASKITAVALAADALLRGADQRRADLHALQAQFLDLEDHRLVEQRAFGDDDLVRLRIHDILGRGAAEDAVAERSDGRAALHDRTHF